MNNILKVLSPVDGSVCAERHLAGPQEVNTALQKAARAQKEWGALSLQERAETCTRFVAAFTAMKQEIVPELAWQMGRPVCSGPHEVDGFEERARTMIALAPQALAPVEPEPVEGLDRSIRHEPLGVVFTIAAWNYPYLIAVNSLIPALMAGNGVLLKHAAQTPLCAERLRHAWEQANGPRDLFQALHMNHHTVARTITHPLVAGVAFTGSVSGGKAVEQAAVGRFIPVGLELGGKDPAYVRADADLAHAAENLADGAFFNSGQSCCGKERLYVHEAVYDAFLERFIEAAGTCRLGNPLESRTTLGPLVRPEAADFVRGQIAQAINAGARSLLGKDGTGCSMPGTAYLAPEILTHVDHSMSVMKEESFGPVIGIMKVGSDAQAVQLMNDSTFGLTASIWSRDMETARTLGEQVETGTLFVNRCDYLDPFLAWTGVKNSGRGCTLSVLGYGHLTRPKSYHLRTIT